MVALGMAAPPFGDEMVFGFDPKIDGQKEDIYIVSNGLAQDNTPPFFYHLKLYPKVRWVQFIKPDQTEHTLKRIKELKMKGETTEGLTVFQFDHKKRRLYWKHRDGMGEFIIVRDGRIYAYSEEKNLEHTIGSILGGTYDSRKVQALRRADELQWKTFLSLWQPAVNPYSSGKISFSEFTHRVAPLFSKLASKQRSYLLNNYLWLAECRPLADIESILKISHPDDELMSFDLSVDIAKHEGHHECRLRVLEEFKLAIKDPLIGGRPEVCKQLAEVAIDFDRKKDAVRLLKLMIESPTLKPRYARVWRDSFLGDYDNLMWRATH